jgi:putative endonuclease
MSGASIWYLYIVRASDNSLYTGITTNVSRRFLEHAATAKCLSNKGAKALRGKHPLKLEFCCEVGSRSESLKLEYKVKSCPKRAKEDLVSGVLSLDTFC